MKRYFVNDVVLFIENDKHIYGTIEKIETREEGSFYTSFANNLLYREIAERQILKDYGEDE